MLPRAAALACLVAVTSHAFDANAQAMVQTFPTKPVTIIVAATPGGALAPAGTPKDTVDRLNTEFNKALNAPDVSQKLAAAGIEPAGGTAAQFGEFIQVEMVKWAKVAKDAGIKPE